jgi:uncharacterized membrane protein
MVTAADLRGGVMEKKAMLATVALAALTMAAGCAHTTGGATAASGVKGECYGVNSCKATGECGGPDHACAGQNTCKGQGWISLTKSVCEGKGGTYKKG